MADEKDKKPNISNAILNKLGGGIETTGRDRAKALIVLVLFVFAIIFFIFPFIIGMGYEFFAEGFSASSIAGVLLAIVVVYLGGSK